MIQTEQQGEEKKKEKENKEKRKYRTNEKKSVLRAPTAEIKRIYKAVTNIFLKFFMISGRLSY